MAFATQQIEKFFDTLIHGERAHAREIVQSLLDSEIAPETILAELFWPCHENLQKMFAADFVSRPCHQYATRLLRMLTAQIQPLLATSDSNGQRVLLIGGPQEGEEIAAQIAGDLLEASGYEVYFVGGGITPDEVIGQVADLRPNVLSMFGNAPSDLPYIREIIDTMQSLEKTNEMQIVVGGGVFNRADGLAAEVGADLWASTPMELVQEIKENPDRRMAEDQRKFGRRRSASRAA